VVEEIKKVTPLVSVVMSIYNGEKYLHEAIDSVLNQTFTDLEFIMIDDGSTDSSLKIMKSYAILDTRIVVVSRGNKGLVSSLNEGIAISKGKYIARMDQDDISLPVRFDEQVKFMEKNNIDICGSSVELFHDCKVLGKWEYPLSDMDIKFTLACMCSFAHPSVMMKKNIFSEVQYFDYPHAEDYKLWTDIAVRDFKMANLNRVLLKYRRHASQTSIVNAECQYNLTQKIASEYRDRLRKNKLLNFNLKYDRISFVEMRNILSQLKLDAVHHNVSDETVLNLAHYMLQHNKYVSIFLYTAYFLEMKSYIELTKLEIVIFMQALFCASRGSIVYQLFRRFF